LRQLRVAVVPRNPSLPHQLTEDHSIHLSEFGGFAKRKRSLRASAAESYGRPARARPRARRTGSVSRGFEPDIMAVKTYATP
jgi:hypothetical protein